MSKVVSSNHHHNHRRKSRDAATAACLPRTNRMALPSWARCFWCFQRKLGAPRSDCLFGVWAAVVSAALTVLVLALCFSLLLLCCHVLLEVPRPTLVAMESELLACSGKVLSEYGVTWFMDFGVVLGGIRHGGFLPHDTPVDIDVGVLACDTVRLKMLAPVLAARCNALLVHRDEFMITTFGSWGIKRAAFR